MLVALRSAKRFAHRLSVMRHAHYATDGAAEAAVGRVNQKRLPPPGLASTPTRAAVAFDDALDDGQAQAGALVFRCPRPG
jgi:hypothetical protein